MHTLEAPWIKASAKCKNEHIIGTSILHAVIIRLQVEENKKWVYESEAKPLTKKTDYSRNDWRLMTC